MTLVQSLAFSRVSSPSLAIGRVQRIRCQARCCGNPDAPVFLVLGLPLCASCRDFRNTLVRLRLPEMRRDK